MGGGCNSLRKALKAKHILNKYNVYTFDIVKKSNGFKNIILDLSKPYIYIYIDKLLKDKKIKKPDFIISSPLCQSFSVAMQSKSTLKVPNKNNQYFTGNPHHYWDFDRNKILTWPNNVKWNGFSGNSYPKGSNSVPKNIAILGERCIQNVLNILYRYKPKHWYIENPEKSLIWKFIRYNMNFKKGCRNIAHYSAYNDNFSKKPTCFLSDIDLKLKHVKSWSKPAIKKIDKHNYAIILSGACKDNKRDELKRERIESELREKLKSKNITVKILYKKNSMDRSEIPCELLIDLQRIIALILILKK